MKTTCDHREFGDLQSEDKGWRRNLADVRAKELIETPPPRVTALDRAREELDHIGRSDSNRPRRSGSIDAAKDWELDKKLIGLNPVEYLQRTAHRGLDLAEQRVLRESLLEHGCKGSDTRTKSGR